MNKATINSKEHWDNRFTEDWDDKGGDKQSVFFANIALKMFPTWLNSYLTDKKNISFLDWGCAEGDGTYIFANTFQKISFTGIDFSDKAIKTAKERYENDRVKFLSKDILTEKYSKTHNIVFASNIFEHFHDPWGVFEKVSQVASDLFIIMAPFNEGDGKKFLTEEHFYRFTLKDFIKPRKGWKLVHFSVMDTSRVENTFWGDSQFMAIYVNEDRMDNLGIDLSFVNISMLQSMKLDDSNYTVDKLTKKYRLLQERERALELEINTLNNKLAEAQNYINNINSSKRLRLVNKIADTVNHKVLPNGSLRRKTASNNKTMFKSLDKEPLDDKQSAVLKSGYFDKSYYLKHNPDVRDAGVDPLWHFTYLGSKEGRSPGPKFITPYYKVRNNIHLDDDVDVFFEFLRDKSSSIRSKDIYNEKQYLKYKSKITLNIISKINKSKNSPISILSMSWDIKLKQRPHHLASELASAGHPVIYIEVNSDIIPREESRNIYIVDEFTYFKVIEDKNMIKKGFFWSLSPTSDLTLAKLLKIKSRGVDIIYDYIDEIHDDISSNTNELLKIYNNLHRLDPVLVVASSKELMAQLENNRGIKKDRLLMAQNAVNIEDFNASANTSIQDDLKEILVKNKPIVGYYGAMAPWLYYELINELTAKRRDLEFIFIGIDYNNSLKNLKIRDNVNYLGAKEYNDLIRYSKHFDCAIIPFQLGDIAKSTSPVKLFEYMAAGVPTVCTKDLQECEGYDYVYMSKNAKEFEKNIDKAIKNRSIAKATNTLQKYAIENTWEKRVSIIDEYLSKIERANS